MEAPPAPQVPPPDRLISISQPTPELTRSSSGRAAPPLSARTFVPPKPPPEPPPEMSVAVAEGCFLSALQPATSCTAYMVPSDGPSPDPRAKARRVQEQVRMRLAERKSSSLPRLDDSLVGPAGESHPALSLNPPRSLLVNNVCFISMKTSGRVLTRTKTNPSYF